MKLGETRGGRGWGGGFQRQSGGLWPGGGVAASGRSPEAFPRGAVLGDGTRAYLEFAVGRGELRARLPFTDLLCQKLLTGRSLPFCVQTKALNSRACG